jgi:hypothetical protein
MVRFIGKPLLYCGVAVFGLLVEGSRPSVEETKPDHLRVAFAKSTDVFQIVKFIRAMLCKGVRRSDGLRCSDNV